LNPVQIGHLGECYVMYSLATLGTKAMKVPDSLDFDLLTNDPIKIEVKTGVERVEVRKRPTKKEGFFCITDRPHWQFANNKSKIIFCNGNAKHINLGRKRICDYYVLVCLKINLKVEKTYIIPSEVVNHRRLIKIGTTDKGMFEKYNETWHLIRESCEV